MLFERRGLYQLSESPPPRKTLVALFQHISELKREPQLVFARALVARTPFALHAQISLFCS